VLAPGAKEYAHMTAKERSASITPNVEDDAAARAWSQVGWLWIAFGALSLLFAIGGMFVRPDAVDEGAWLIGLLSIGVIFAVLFISAGLMAVFDKRRGRHFGVLACCVAFPLALILILYGAVGSPLVVVWGVATIAVVGFSIKSLVDRARYEMRRTAQATAHERPPERRSDRRIFISYRRADSAEVTDRISEHLTSRFVEENVFRDIQSIPLGIDFKEHVDAAIARCDVLLVIIGSHWLTAQASGGRRRIDDPMDFVRLEIEAALTRDIPIIPLILQNAAMPQADELPSSLRRLAFRNGLRVRPDPDFRNDLERLFTALDAVRPRALDKGPLGASEAARRESHSAHL
jgi:hypothetical protein